MALALPMLMQLPRPGSELFLHSWAATIPTQSPFSHAVLPFQKHEDESEAWLHRQVTIPRASPHLRQHASRHACLVVCAASAQQTGLAQ